MNDMPAEPPETESTPRRRGAGWRVMAMRSVLGLISSGLAGSALLRWEANGWGSLVWLAALVFMAIIRAPYARRAAGEAISERQAVLTERVLLALVMLGGSVLPLVHLATGALGFVDYALPDWAAFAGAGLLIPAFWLFWRSHADLDRNWSVTTELHESHKLVTSGVYKRIRHPMYAAIWLIFLAQSLLVQNWIAGPAGAFAFAVMYFIRIPYEEAMMRERFGDAYDEYSRRAGRLWPR